MGVIDKAVSWAVSIAQDDTHGYDQGSRWGPDYDCSSLVITAYENAGVPVKTNGATYTGNMVDVFLACGFKDVTSSITLGTGAGLKKGDVVWKSGHVEMVSSDNYLVGASINENGETTGGVTGDQTGGEIRVRTYYNGPWVTVLRYPENTGEDINITKADVTSKNGYLTLAQMQKNALYLYAKFSSAGWTLNAVAGMLGNMQRESTINPGIWQNLDEGNTSLGFGLVQWTPATTLIDWAEANGMEPADIDAQIARILYELENGLQYYPTDSYPETFTEYSQSTATPEYLAMAFLKNYERAGVSAEDERQENARYWYDFLATYTPSAGGKKKRGLSLLLMYIATRR